MRRFDPDTVQNGHIYSSIKVQTREHVVTDKESAIYKHLPTCEHLAFIYNLFNLPDTLSNITAPTISSNKDYVISVVQNNTTVLDYDDNWNLLLYRGLPQQTPIAIT